MIESKECSNIKYDTNPGVKIIWIGVKRIKNFILGPLYTINSTQYTRI